MCKEERTVNQETNVQEKEARVRQPWTAQRVGDILLNNALLIIMAIAVVYIAIKNPNFIKPASLINILSQTAAYLPAALGIGGCIVLTGTDLSAGRAVGITACISASLLQNAANMANKMWPQIGTLPIPVVIVLAMLIGAAMVFVPEMLVSLIGKGNTLGGAVIKLSTALAFLLGWQRGLAALMAGLLAAVIVMAIVQKLNRKKRRQPFALIPFLAAAAMVVFFV